MNTAEPVSCFTRPGGIHRRRAPSCFTRPRDVPHPTTYRLSPDRTSCFTRPVFRKLAPKINIPQGLRAPSKLPNLSNHFIIPLLIPCSIVENNGGRSCKPNEATKSKKLV
jgi:hypothetical protein